MNYSRFAVEPDNSALIRHWGIKVVNCVVVGVGVLQKGPCFSRFSAFLRSVIFLILCTHSNQTVANWAQTNLNH